MRARILADVIEVLTPIRGWTSRGASTSFRYHAADESRPVSSSINPQRPVNAHRTGRHRNPRWRRAGHPLASEAAARSVRRGKRSMPGWRGILLGGFHPDMVSVAGVRPSWSTWRAPARRSRSPASGRIRRPRPSSTSAVSATRSRPVCHEPWCPRPPTPGARRSSAGGRCRSPTRSRRPSSTPTEASRSPSSRRSRCRRMRRSTRGGRPRPPWISRTAGVSAWVSGSSRPSAETRAAVAGGGEGRAAGGGWRRRGTSSSGETARRIAIFHRAKSPVALDCPPSMSRLRRREGTMPPGTSPLRSGAGPVPPV